MGKEFVKYSSKGQLVPDDITIELWTQQIESMVHSAPLPPGKRLPRARRHPAQRQPGEDRLGQAGSPPRLSISNAPDKAKVYDRLKRRALKENRLDDINDEVIERRQKIYESESQPVLDYYGPKLTTSINSDQPPFQVLRDILNEVTAWAE